MQYSRELLFFFSALGVFNGLLLGLYFIFLVKPKNISNKFLGVFILMLCVRVGKSVFFHFNSDLSYHYLQLGLTACFFIGPFMYIYICSIMDEKETRRIRWKVHIIVLSLLALMIGLFYPFKFNIKLWNEYIIPTIYLEWFIYILASAYQLRNRIKEMFKAKERFKNLDFWIFSLLFSNLIILSSYYFANFTNYISGALTFSFLLYLLILFLFTRKGKQIILLTKSVKYADKKIDEAKANNLLVILDNIIKEESLYKNPNLKSSEVAKKIKITTHEFSQLLNDNFGKSFPVFINEYRVRFAKKMIKENSKLTIESVGYESGFNSKSAFYNAFKKEVGVTPAQFKKQT